MLFALHEAFEVARAPGLTQFAQRLCFDLTDPFAGHGELLADFLERVVRLLADTEAHAQNLLFARCQRRQHLAGLLAQIALDRGLDRRGREFVLDEVAQ